MKLYRNIFIAIIVILACAGLTFYLTARHYGKKEATDFGQVYSIRENSNGQYKFINPLLAYDLPESRQFGEYTQLSDKLTDLINKEKSNGNADDVSVYFRGSQGRWVGINDTDNYYPASLLKVVIMMAYYQQAQSNPGILDKQLAFTPDIKKQLTASEFNTPSNLSLNSFYKISDLIHSMIVDSDNGATYTLLGSLDSKSLDEVYTDFGLQAPSDNVSYQISAKNYSFFFRILYNATYLDREYSEKALDLLSQASFTDGLVAGLPAKTVVAHKYGEHVLNDDQGTQLGVELHDCGIIYTQNSYLLCVMTRGRNIDNLKKVIQDISSLVYKENK